MPQPTGSKHWKKNTPQTDSKEREEKKSDFCGKMFQHRINRITVIRHVHVCRGPSLICVTGRLLLSVLGCVASLTSDFVRLKLQRLVITIIGAAYLLTYSLAPVSYPWKSYRRHGIGLQPLECLFQDLDSPLARAVMVAVQLVSFAVEVAPVPEYLWMLLTVLLVWSLSAMQAASAMGEVAPEDL